jgi:pimeloyl-ACP methyl ester carboxylesterase
LKITTTRNTNNLFRIFLTFITIIISVVFGNSSAIAADHSPTPKLTSANCMFDIPLGAVEGMDVECGYLTVPENRQDPNGKTIELAVAIIKSLSPSPYSDPIIMAQGGPGGSTIETYASLLLTDSQLRNERDIILFDQRGTLYSKPDLFCEEIDQLISDSIEMELSKEESARLEKEAMTHCRNRLKSEGVNLSAYNSLENAADINDLRQALEYETINLYGVSYGTLLALHTMREYPSIFRSVILDAVVPPQVNFITESSDTMNRSFRQLFETCENSIACNADFPNLERVFYNVIEELENKPARAEMVDIETGTTYRAVIDGETFASALFQMLYSSKLVPALPRMIYDANAGNFDFFSRIYSIFLFDRTMSYGMYYSVLCAEDADFDPSQHNLKNLKPELAEFEEGDAQLFLDICSIWDVESLGTIMDAPILSDIPTLLLSGNFDPITPPDYAALVSSTLPNSYNIVFPSGSHGAAFEGDCQDQIINDFLSDPEKMPDITCIDKISEPQYFTKDNLINIPGLIEMLNLDRAIAIELLIFSFCMLFLLSAFLVFPISWIFKKIKRKATSKTDQTLTESEGTNLSREELQDENSVQKEPVLLRLSNWIAVLIPTILTIFTLGLVAIITEMVINNDYRLFFGVPATASPWFFLPAIVMVLGGMMLFISIVVWLKKYWNVWKRTYYSIFTICTFVNISILIHWRYFS